MQHSFQSLRVNMQTLQAGDWIGQGAMAFYQEMDDSVLPTLQRLINALDTAANTTLQVSRLMQEAESQAAGVLKGPAGGGEPIGARSAAGAGLAAAVGGSAVGGQFTGVKVDSVGGAQFVRRKEGGVATGDSLNAGGAQAPTGGSTGQDKWGDSVNAWAASGEAASKVNDGISLRDLQGSGVSGWTVTGKPKNDGDKDDKP
jgi:WXG100 family type VII secretion target